MKQEMYFPSADGETQIHAVEWIPGGEIRAVLQIVHGMVEYIDRYDEFARYLNERGYYVVGHDHLGHGESVTGDGRHGYFHKTDGNACVIADIRYLRQKTREKYPDVPYFILGHSMGSFLTRQYLKTCESDFSGAVIMGTGNKPGLLLAAGKLICKVVGALKGDDYRSAFVNNMAFGGYNRRFRPTRTAMDWLTKDEEIVDKYLKDPYCTFVFTVNAYYHMFCGMQTLLKSGNLENIRKELPVFFVAGQDDPVGSFGKDVEKVCRKYRACGIRDVELKLYKGDRHEILNETDREQVYGDIYHWMEKRI